MAWDLMPLELGFSINDGLVVDWLKSQPEYGPQDRPVLALTANRSFARKETSSFGRPRLAESAGGLRLPFASNRNSDA